MYFEVAYERLPTVSEFRYSQYCALARAAEIIGERWTLLLLRELLLGPRRFCDLSQRLPGVSSSVLTQRLTHLEERGVVRRRRLPPPAGSTVYEVTDLGAEVAPVLGTLTRWGTHFMQARRSDDLFEPEWLLAALPAFAATGPAPVVTLEARLREGDQTVALRIVGGRDGVHVRPGGQGDADALVDSDAATFMALASGLMSGADAIASGAATVEGDAAVLDTLPSLFDFGSGSAQTAAVS